VTRNVLTARELVPSSAGLSRTRRHNTRTTQQHQNINESLRVAGSASHTMQSVACRKHTDVFRCCASSQATPSSSQNRHHSHSEYSEHTARVTARVALTASANTSSQTIQACMQVIDTNSYNQIYHVWFSLHIPVNAQCNAQSTPTSTILCLISDAGTITVAIANTIQQPQLSHHSQRAAQAHDTSTLICSDAPAQHYT
jgi:hypothetical protein